MEIAAFRQQVAEDWAVDETAAAWEKAFGVPMSAMQKVAKIWFRMSSTVVWPVIASRTRSVSWGAPACSLEITRRTFLISSMRCDFVCSRPAVSISTASMFRLLAAWMPSYTTAEGSAPARCPDRRHARRASPQPVRGRRAPHRQRGRELVRGRDTRQLRRAGFRRGGEPAFRPAPLPAAEIPAGESELCLCGRWLHRGAPSVGRGLRAAQEPARERRLAGARHPPRHCKVIPTTR